MYIPAKALQTGFGIALVGSLASPPETFVTSLKTIGADRCLALDRYPSEASTVNLQSCVGRIHSPRRWEISITTDLTLLRRAGSEFCLSARDFNGTLPSDEGSVRLEVCPSTIDEASNTGMLWRHVRSRRRGKHGRKHDVSQFQLADGPPLWLLADEDGLGVAAVMDADDERFGGTLWSLA